MNIYCGRSYFVIGFWGMAMSNHATWGVYVELGHDRGPQWGIRVIFII